MKFIKTSLTLFFLVLLQIGYTQSPLPIIKASSSKVDVRINGTLKKADWELNPKIKIDTYYTKRVKGSTNITFITDLDSISFHVTNYNSYDFIIRLNNKDSCYTRVKSLKSAQRVNTKTFASNPDTIPFTLGRDNRIYIEGKINDSETLKILYDNGAEGTSLAKDVVNDNVKLTLDGMGVSIGTGGEIYMPTSSANKLQIGNLVWEDEPINIGTKKYGKGADAIVGYSIFSDKVVEIDYEKNMMIIHDTLPKIKDYTKATIKWINFLPYLEAELLIGSKICKDWFLIDIGAGGSIMANTESATRNGLYTLPKIKEGETSGIGPNKIKNETVLLPRLVIQKSELFEVPLVLEMPSKNSTGLGNLLGMDILKRFNTVIDYQNFQVYLKPNSLLTESF